MVECLNVAARRQSSRAKLESGRCDVATNSGLNAANLAEKWEVCVGAACSVYPLTLWSVDLQ